MKKFFVLWASQAASLLGTSVVGFALAWYLAQDTGSAAVLSVAMIMNILPIVFVGPFIGPFIDRWDRKKIMIWADVVTMLLTLMLVILFFTDKVELWHIYVVMLGRSASGSVQGPAMVASVPLLVPEKHLVRVNSLTSTMTGLIFLLGPLAGAFLMKLLPVHQVLFVDIITAVIAVSILSFLKIPNPSRTTLSEKMNVWGDMVQGIRYLVSWRGLMYMFLLGAMINFFAVPLESLMPLFVTNYLGDDVLKMGWLTSALAGGSVLGGLILSVWGGFKRRMHTILAGFIVWCFALMVFSFTTENLFYLGLSMWFLSGVCNAFFNAPMTAILQSAIPTDMQGRLFAVIGSINTAMIPLALIIAGPVADRFGVRLIYQIPGVVILVMVLLAFSSRKLRNLEDEKASEIIEG